MGKTTKTVWTESMLDFIRQNFDQLTTPAIAEALGLKTDNVRTQCTRMGLKHMNMEYWTDEQVEFLKENYRSAGDVELALMFSEKWAKEKGWTMKHIEKKRMYLGLKRTKEEINLIRWKNYQSGLMHAPSRFIDQEFAKDGEIRYWKQESGRVVPRIKIDGRFRDWARWAWENENGPVQKGYNVVFISGPEILKLSNLELKSNLQMVEDMHRRIYGLTDTYVAGMLGRGSPGLKDVLLDHPDLLELKRNQLKLQREIKNGKQQ